jgi:hypothetical protein
MVLMIRLLRVFTAFWFWFFVVMAITAFCMTHNVATGPVPMATRVQDGIMMFLISLPGLVGWILTHRWVVRSRFARRPQGFAVVIGSHNESERAKSRY